MRSSRDLAVLVVVMTAAPGVQPLPSSSTKQQSHQLSRRTLGISAAAAFAATSQVASCNADTEGARWPLWPALPLAPYGLRRTVVTELVPNRLWTFDQLIGVFYVHVPIRMSVIALDSGGLCEPSAACCVPSPNPSGPSQDIAPDATLTVGLAYAQLSTHPSHQPRSVLRCWRL